MFRCAALYMPHVVRHTHASLIIRAQRLHCHNIYGVPRLFLALTHCWIFIPSGIFILCTNWMLSANDNRNSFIWYVNGVHYKSESLCLYHSNPCQIEVAIPYCLDKCGVDIFVINYPMIFWSWTLSRTRYVYRYFAN